MRTSRKRIIIAFGILLYAAGIALIVYFKNNRETFEQAAEYLVKVSENYPDDTEFSVHHWFVNFEHYDNIYEIRNMKTDKQIEWRKSDLPNRKQEQVIYKVMGLCRTGGLHMTKRKDGCLISFCINDNSDNWKEIVYSTNPNKNFSAELQKVGLEEYDYSDEKLAENWYFWYVSG